MNTIALKFDSKAELLSFYQRFEKSQFTVDLHDLLLMSSFSEADVVVAIKNYNARVLIQEPVY